MAKILALWATPRTTSTAFEWMMRMRGDMTCFHEPLGEWWYKGDGAKWPRLEVNSERIAGLTFDGILSQLLAVAERQPTFSKDFPHYHYDYHGGWDAAFLSHFTHSFLIRDPAKVVTSMAKQWDEFLLAEIGIPQQRDLFDRLMDQSGTPPPLIDSDDLLEDPETIVRLWCEAVGIPFIKEALTWEPGERREVSWYDGGSWHDNLKASRGLTPQPRKDADLSQASDTVKRLYEACLPHYEHMYQHRLRP